MFIARKKASIFQLETFNWRRY